ncbi:MAG: bifunctional 5,10-methylenetetrahydrofolate dehydrogenase/5,10-methenyltetrahydrofolate cyclohydrolase [Patescibacteria group bacterium]
MTEILNGAVLANNIKRKAKTRIAKLKHPPGLAVILVGDHPASALYVRLKEEAAKDVGIYVEKFTYPKDATTQELIQKISDLNARPDIHGILVQLPLVDQDVEAVIGAIHPSKDVDGFHPENRRSLLANAPVLVPPVALAVMRLIQATRRPLTNRSAVVLGNSAVFAEPIIELLREAGVTATLVTRNTPALSAVTRGSDIIIVALGEAGFLKPDMVQEAAIVIDVGTNKVGTRTVGDADPALEGHVGFLSKVPGGVGPLTVAYLLTNVMKAMESQHREGIK